MPVALKVWQVVRSEMSAAVALRLRPRDRHPILLSFIGRSLYCGRYGQGRANRCAGVAASYDATRQSPRRYLQR